MTTITTHDLPVRLPDVFAGLALGEEFVVTDQGLPIARILPPGKLGKPPQESADAWVARWYAWTDAHPKRDISIDDTRDAIHDRCGE